MPTGRPQGLPRMFLSYSHRNQPWKRRILNALAPLEDSGTLAVWHDGHIEHGDDWFERIAVEIQRSRFVVLLLTPEFLGSDFIRATELPYIEAVRSRSDLSIYPWICEPCGWQDVSLFAEKGARIQCHPADGVALSERADEEVEALLAAWAATLAARSDALVGRPRLAMQQEEARHALQHGRESLASGDYRSACASFEEAVRLSPGLAEAHYLHALALLEGRRAKKVNRPTIERVERHLQAAIRHRGSFLDYFMLALFKTDYYEENGLRTPGVSTHALLDSAMAAEVVATFDQDLLNETFEYTPWVDNAVSRWLVEEE